MKKLIALALVILVATSFGFAQSSSKVYKIKLGHASSTESTRHKALLVAKDYLEKQSGGRLILEIYPGAQSAMKQR